VERRWAAGLDRTSVFAGPQYLRPMTEHGVSDERVACGFCGQDYQTWYRVRADGRTFLLCPECDSVWLSADDRHKSPAHGLRGLFPAWQARQAWDLIEPCDPPAGQGNRA